MKLTQLVQPWLKQGGIECDVTGVQNDSRQIKPGDLFIAYPGAATDGRLYIEKAIAAGAVAIAYDPVEFPAQIHIPAAIPSVKIPQLASNLAEIATRFYHNPGEFLQITGITGTNGKTTIAYQLAQAHQMLGQGAAYIGTIGQGLVNALKPLDNTTPDALYLVKLLNDYKEAGLKQVCMEVSSHALNQQRVDAVAFEQAVFTNLSLDHLDYHHTMQDYAAAKALLFARPELQWAIINQDDSYQELMSAALGRSVKRLSYGIHNECDVRAINWHTDISGSEIEIQSPWGKHLIKIQALGQFNIYNSLAIFASLLASSYSPDDVVAVMSELKAAPGRLELVAQNPYVLVDYAHTPDALENVLSTLNQLKKGRLWVVFGCGGDRDKTKRPIMAKVASDYADKIIITSDNPRSEDPQVIIDEIMAGIVDKEAVIALVDREAAIAYALHNADKDDIILIAGKGHESYQQIGRIKQPFSDREVVQRLKPSSFLLPQS